MTTEHDSNEMYDKLLENYVLANDWAYDAGLLWEVARRTPFIDPMLTERLRARRIEAEAMLSEIECALGPDGVAYAESKIESTHSTWATGPLSLHLTEELQAVTSKYSN